MLSLLQPSPDGFCLLNLASAHADTSSEPSSQDAAEHLKLLKLAVPIPLPLPNQKIIKQRVLQEWNLPLSTRLISNQV